MLGAAQVSVCQKAYTYHFPEAEREQLPDKCRNLSGQTDKAGCFSASVDMSTFNLTGYMYSHTINIVATVVEEGTGFLWLLTSPAPSRSRCGSTATEAALGSLRAFWAVDECLTT